jgi:transcriptional regulator with XRE-family HTH domain
MERRESPDARLTARIVKLTRVARGWRQIDLADALGVSRARVSQVERAKANPGPALLARLAAVLGSEDLAEAARAREAK